MSAVKIVHTTYKIANPSNTYFAPEVWAEMQAQVEEADRAGSAFSGS